MNPVNSSDEAARQECVILTERCTDRHCGRLRYGELTDDLNTHWHVKRGVCLVPLADVRAEAVADEMRRIERALFGDTDDGWVPDDSELPVGELRRLLTEAGGSL